MVKPCTPIDGLIDVKDAISYLREHAPNLGVNPQKILAVGASAGAQLAFASCQNNPITHTTPQPHAPNYIVAFSPVLRNDEKGYGASRVGGENIPWFSTWNLYLTTPHHLPPSIIFSGENDPLIKLKDLELFQEQAVQKGDRIEIVPIPNVGHSMKKTIPEIYQITEAQIVTFLNNNHFN